MRACSVREVEELKVLVLVARPAEPNPLPKVHEALGLAATAGSVATLVTASETAAANGAYLAPTAAASAHTRLVARAAEMQERIDDAKDIAWHDSCQAAWEVRQLAKIIHL